MPFSVLILTTYLANHSSHVIDVVIAHHFNQLMCFSYGRLDVILGKVGSKAKDVYESKISLASRIVKVERAVRHHISCQSAIDPLICYLCSTIQVEDIENKVDQLLEMYLEDRARMNSATLTVSGPVYSSHTGSSLANRSPPPPPPSTPVMQSFPSEPGLPSYVKSKLLVGEKQSSEPNTPITRSFDKQITRGNSDLSQRFAKKRVTLRHSLDTSVNRCSSAGTQRTVAEVQRSARSDSSIGGITLSSATASAPAIKLETDIEANHSNAQNDSQTTLISSIDSLEPEMVSEASTLGTDLESLCLAEETPMTLAEDSRLDFIDETMPMSSNLDDKQGYLSIARDPLDKLLIEMPDTGNESDCDSSQTTVIPAETQSLLSPISSPMSSVSPVSPVSGTGLDSTKLHPKYHHHPHHSHHHSHHHYKTSHQSTDNL